MHFRSIGPIYCKINLQVDISTLESSASTLESSASLSIDWKASQNGATLSSPLC